MVYSLVGTRIERQFRVANMSGLGWLIAEIWTTLSHKGLRRRRLVSLSTATLSEEHKKPIFSKRNQLESRNLSGVCKT